MVLQNNCESRRCHPMGTIKNYSASFISNRAIDYFWFNKIRHLLKLTCCYPPCNKFSSQFAFAWNYQQFIKIVPSKLYADTEKIRIKLILGLSLHSWQLPSDLNCSSVLLSIEIWVRIRKIDNKWTWNLVRSLLP